jgi:hypothetical protein
MRHVLPWIAAAMTIAALAAAPAEAITRLERSGTVGLSLFGGYGTVTGKSRYGYDFAEGPGYGITLRYTVHPHVSLGLFFENQAYDAVPGLMTSGNDPVAINKLVSTQVMADVYFYRDRNLDVSQYAVFGLGFYRPEIHLPNKDVLFPALNLVLSAGVGAEVFIRENWGLDLSGRVFGYFGDGLADQERDPLPDEGSLSIGLQGHVGFIYYLLR